MIGELTNYQLLTQLVRLDTNECIPWPRGSNKRGYGFLRVDGKLHKAHRVAFKLYNGYSPVVVRHQCDNPICVNPKHLLPGTQADNVRDMFERNRCSRKGSANGRAILSAEDVLVIRQTYVPGSRSGSGTSSFDLARRFKVSRSQIQRIVTNNQWE